MPRPRSSCARMRVSTSTAAFEGGWINAQTLRANGGYT
jgi:hypothetical protein